MNEILTSSYRLHFRQAPSWGRGRRAELTGVLVAVQNSQGERGYSASTFEDPHSIFFRQAVAQAEEDLRMRQKKVSCREIFANFRLENNFFLDLNSPELLKTADGFRFVKIKVSGREDESLKVREVLEQFPNFQYRLDFNAQSKDSELEKFFSDWTDSHFQRLHYVEDPCAYEPAVWEKWSRRMPLAFDGAGFSSEKLFQPGILVEQKLPFQFLILKPSWQDPRAWTLWAKERKLKVTLTSAMDHPVAQVQALKAAALIDKEFPGILQVCGLRTGFLFQETTWVKEIEDETPYVHFARGLGIGFDELFKQENWEKV